MTERTRNELLFVLYYGAGFAGVGYIVLRSIISKSVLSGNVLTISISMFLWVIFASAGAYAFLEILTRMKQRGAIKTSQLIHGPNRLIHTLKVTVTMMIVIILLMTGESLVLSGGSITGELLKEFFESAYIALGISSIIWDIGNDTFHLEHAL